MENITVHDLIQMIGRKSTDPEFVQWYTSLGIGAPPSALKDGGKLFQDKQHQLQIGFDYGIINDRFYPPVISDEDFNYDCYCSRIEVFQISYGANEDEYQDRKPATFWQDFIHPGSTLEECIEFFDGNYGKDGAFHCYTFHKKLNETVELIVSFTSDNRRIRWIEIFISECTEIFGYRQLSLDWKSKLSNWRGMELELRRLQPYLLLIKWLFDQRYLLLPEDVYQQPLGLDEQALLDFTNKYLNGHLWNNQLVDVPYLYDFLFSVAQSGYNTIKTPEGKTWDIHIDHLYIKAAELWETYKKLEKNYKDPEWNTKMYNITTLLHLDEEQSLTMLRIFTEAFEIFKRHSMELRKY
ncbi:hypothetical protein [Chitinophaga flava]|uniref:Uncharacterized protein n=1 Tax=Chitinophaga flava TaxID=2259036 RepID=A0A365XVJ6_9BACT|nr:hypothetical protein [Chitinophaga flava]RBL90392.1 hypothetical protein DF182_28430 [Chitinophaga flava]